MFNDSQLSDEPEHREHGVSLAFGNDKENRHFSYLGQAFLLWGMEVKMVCNLRK